MITKTVVIMSLFALALAALFSPEPVNLVPLNREPINEPVVQYGPFIMNSE